MSKTFHFTPNFYFTHQSRLMKEIKFSTNIKAKLALKILSRKFRI